jgi:hypothetical protein
MNRSSIRFDFSGATKGINMKLLSQWIVRGLLMLPLGGYAAAGFAASDIPSAEGLRALRDPVLGKFIHHLEPGQEEGAFGPGGFDELLPYVMASPDQLDAGSCLYMSITGIAEWWLARINPRASREADGPIDLSERFSMNLAGYEEDDSGLANWRTDAMLLFNRVRGRVVRNKDFRFTKGWYTGSLHDGTARVAAEGDEGARYDEGFNWLDLRQSIKSGWVYLPRFERNVILVDANRDQWAIGVAQPDIAERVKIALRRNKAPVQVIYNHNGYWHSVYVVGFNDNADNGDCAWTRDFRKTISERAVEFQQNADNATTPGERDYWQVRATRAAATSTKIEQLWTKYGGCSASKGAFYVRDSIYPDEGGPMYDYDPSRTGEESPYSRKIVLKEYDWLRYFANHVVQPYPVR